MSIKSIQSTTSTDSYDCNIIIKDKISSLYCNGTKILRCYVNNTDVITKTTTTTTVVRTTYSLKLKVSVTASWKQGGLLIYGGVVVCEYWRQISIAVEKLEGDGDVSNWTFAVRTDFGDVTISKANPLFESSVGIKIYGSQGDFSITSITGNVIANITGVNSNKNINQNLSIQSGNSYTFNRSFSEYEDSNYYKIQRIYPNPAILRNDSIPNTNGIPAGTYTPSSFRTQIQQFIALNGSRMLQNSVTITVAGKTVTFPAGTNVKYGGEYGGNREHVCFAGSITSSMRWDTSQASYIVYGTSVSEPFTKWSQYPITISNDLNFK